MVKEATIVNAWMWMQQQPAGLNMAITHKNHGQCDNKTNMKTRQQQKPYSDKNSLSPSPWDVK